MTHQQAFEPYPFDGFIQKDAQTFADTIVGLLNDPQQANNIGKSARATMEKNYSWAKNLDKMSQIIFATTDH